MPTSELMEKLNTELETITKLKLNPIYCERFEHTNGIPLYSPQLNQQLQQIKKDMLHMDGMAIFGNYTGAISLRAMAESASMFVNHNF
jgi:hypothetical protein